MIRIPVTFWSRVVGGALLLVVGTVDGAPVPQVRRTADRAGETWACDFENVPLGQLATLGVDTGRTKAALVERVPGGGTCLRIETPEPATFCGLWLTRPVVIEKNLILSFDHREEIQEGFEGAYLGMSFRIGGKQAAWTSDRFSGEWRHVEVVLPRLELRYGFEGRMKAGLTFERIRIYGRSKDRKQRGDSPCRMKVFFDNFRIYTGTARSTAPAGKPYTSHNNPPLFDWSGASGPGTQFQYSMDADFPPTKTVTATLPSRMPFYVPDNPLKPGAWFFRRWTRGELYDGWGRVQSVFIPGKTHHYRLPDIDMTPLIAAPRPRLFRRIRPDGKPVSPAERDRLVRRARSWAEQGVQEHPGPFRKGDPRWPNWIDWYGKVAGRITNRTGSRLRRTAEAAILTRHPDAIAAARTLLLGACKWDPDGGSAERYGDLQAAGLLRGMVWCYDACETALTPAERRKTQAVIKERVLQFYRRISPFRLNPAQNHPWKRNTVVAESALVMMGAVPEAREWFGVAVHNFVYRILPSMGFDGEDAEGISYWRYGVNMLANCADLLLFMADVNVYDHPWLKRTCRFPIYCAPPNAYAISFADNSPKGNDSIVGPYGTDLAGLLGTRTRDPYALWYSDTPAPIVPPRPPADIPQSIIYPYIGYALFHTCLSEGLEDVGVGLYSGTYYAGHQHPDLNDFVIHAYGDKLAVLGGYYDWYGSPHFKAYSHTTLAHNTLLVDGKPQQPKTSGSLRAWFDSPGFGYTVGDASDPAVYHGMLRRFQRRLLFLKPRFVLIHDQVETDGTPRRVDWLLHGHTPRPFPADSARGTFTILRPNAVLQGRFFAPGAVNLTVRKSFEIPPQKPRESVFLAWDQVQPEWTLTATPEKKRSRIEFFTAMEVRRAGEGAGRNSNMRGFENDAARGCELRAPYGTYFVLLRKPGVRSRILKAEGLETDGEVAAVLLAPDGTPADALAVQATFLRFRGRFLFRGGPVPSDWALRVDGSPRTVSGRLLVDESPHAMQGRLFRCADGDLGVWWASLKSEETYRAEVSIEGWTGERPPRVRLNGRTVTGTHHILAVREGTRCLTVTGRGGFRRVAVSRLRYRALPAEVLPRTTATGPGEIAIDADSPGPIAQSERRGRVVNKIAATGGKAFCNLDGPVQWAEWRFTVPAEGDYWLLVRAASECETIDREVRIDGNPFPASGAAVRMKGTGGWCRSRDDWGWYRVVADSGRPAVVRLTRGLHTLRWEVAKGSQNVDLFVFRPTQDSR